MRWVYDDGGRAAAGFRGKTGDCICRAICIATGRSYREIYDRLNALGASERKSKRRRRGKSGARTGVHRSTLQRLMRELGMTWVPLMGIGTGCTVHVRAEELPQVGTHILSLSRHVCALVNGVIHDTYDPSRDGTRCVYGYWTLKGEDHEDGSV